MSTFPTAGPITAVVDVVAGAVEIVAGDRDDTVVAISPRDPDRASDVRVAEQATVEFRDGTLTVSAGRRFISLGRGGAVNVRIALPARSRLHASSASADIHADGDYTECKLASASGHVTIDAVTGKVKADSASGHIAVRRASGSVSISTASGEATLGDLDGDVSFRGASGGLTVRRFVGNLNAHTASGDVVVTNAISGTVSAHTSSGEVDVGIAEGTAANLDVRTTSGAVRNTLTPSAGPLDGDQTLLLSAKTRSGDVIVRRGSSGD